MLLFTFYLNLFVPNVVYSNLHNSIQNYDVVLGGDEGEGEGISQRKLVTTVLPRGNERQFGEYNQ